MVDDLITYSDGGGSFLGRASAYTENNVLRPAFFYHQSAGNTEKYGMAACRFTASLLGLVCSAWYFMKKHGKSLGEVADFVAPLAPPGKQIFFGRHRQFHQRRTLGASHPTFNTWAMVFPGDLAGNAPRHPSQLYEALLEGVRALCRTVARVLRETAPPRQRHRLVPAALRGVPRFSVEFARQPDAHLGFVALDWMTMGQLLSLPMDPYRRRLLFFRALRLASAPHRIMIFQRYPLFQANAYENFRGENF